MLRLGGQVIGTENARDFSSAIKGETLEDTVRIVAGVLGSASCCGTQRKAPRRGRRRYLRSR